LRIGREGKCAGCGDPPSSARSQKAGIGILGKTKEKAALSGCFFFAKWSSGYEKK